MKISQCSAQCNILAKLAILLLFLALPANGYAEFEIIAYLDDEPGRERITIYNGTTIKIEHIDSSDPTELYPTDATIVEESIQVVDIGGHLGQEIVGVSTGSWDDKVFIINNRVDKHHRHQIEGDILPDSLRITNLGYGGGDEILGLTAVDDNGGKKLFIINDYNRLNFEIDQTSPQSINQLWHSRTFSLPAAIPDIVVDYEDGETKTVDQITVHHFQPQTSQLIIPCIDELLSITYGRLPTDPFDRYGIREKDYDTVPDEYLVMDMGGDEGKEIVGLYQENDKRGVFILNPASPIKDYIFDQGITSPNLLYTENPGSNHYVTNDVIVTTIGGSINRGIVGFYQNHSGMLSLFQIGYEDGYNSYRSKTRDIGYGGVYLGVHNRQQDARYVLGYVDNASPGLEIYGYYGGNEVKGGFIVKNNLTSIHYYPVISHSGSLSNFFGQNSNIEDESAYLVDPDGDSVVNGWDDCPTTIGSDDPDGDGVCAPLDECPNNFELVSLTVCGSCIANDRDCDGYNDDVDACPDDPNGYIDDDNDGVCLPEDECPGSSGWVDNDNDNTCAPLDQCENDSSKITAGLCGCNKPEPLVDVNGDGQITSADCNISSCPGDPVKFNDPGICGCGVPDIDSDGDGVMDCLDECSFDPAKTKPGECGCFTADTDIDGNSIIDCLEAPGSENAAYYHNDPTGTPEAITDNTGSPVWRAVYMPFGEEYTYSGSLYNDRRFIAKEKDIETGLSYFGARYMDVGIGRFMAPDPVRVVDAGKGEINKEILADPQRLNLYGYGLNNPFKFVDLDGEFSIRAVYSPATETYLFRATFQKVPRSAMGKILEKTAGRPAKTVYTAITKEISFLGGDAVGYNKQGLGLKQAWNESHYDSIFKDKLTNKEKKDLSSGVTSETDMESILRRFASEKGYNKMNYPAPSKMIKAAKENFDNSPMGSIYKPKKENE